MSEPSIAIQQKRRDVREAFREMDKRLAVIDKEIKEKEGEYSDAEVEAEEHPWRAGYFNEVDQELSDLYDEKRDLENGITGFKNSRQKARYRQKEYEESIRRYKERRVNRNNI